MSIDNIIENIRYLNIVSDKIHGLANATCMGVAEDSPEQKLARKARDAALGSFQDKLTLNMATAKLAGELLLAHNDMTVDEAFDHAKEFMDRTKQMCEIE